MISCKHSGQAQRPSAIYWYGRKLMNLCSKYIVTRNRSRSARSMAWCSKCERPPCPYRRTLQKVSSGEAKADKARFMNIAEGSLEESRYYLAGTRPRYGGPQEGRMNLLEEVSRLLNAYAKAILASDSWLLSRCFWRDIKGAALAWLDKLGASTRSV